VRESLPAKQWRSFAAAGVICVVAVIAFATVSRVALTAGSSAGSFQPTAACMSVPRAPYLGVAALPPITGQVRSFTEATNTRPTVIQFYNPFGAPFQAREAAEAASLGALPVVQLNPRQQSLAQIAAGRYDGYLRDYGSAVKDFQCKIVLSFGHEMNGSWYSWGCQHVSAQVFVAAWRHIVSVIRGTGARNVIWMWTTNSAGPGVCPLGERYPGDQYVTWVGVDGYLRQPGQSFATVFTPTLAQIHTFSRRPILIAEAGVVVTAPGAPDRIRDLFQGAASAPGVMGVTYFDASTTQYGDYRPQDNAAVLAAYQQAAARYKARL
jgi:glycosyl hydrolase family 26